MKYITISFLSLFMAVTGFSQGLNYGVRGLYTMPITNEKLNDAKTMIDINPGYPASWVNDYISTEVVTTSNGKVMTSTGFNDMLTSEQKNNLSTADLGTDIVVDVNYNYKNSATDAVEMHTVHFTVTVIPEKEAEFPGGHQEMTQYLLDNAINKIPEPDSKKIQHTLVRFTVDEQGKIANAQIFTSSGDQKIDNMLLKAINRMPKWIPAENSNGEKVKQEFEFSVGSGGC